MTTSWTARSLPVSYCPPFRLHGTPIICSRGEKSIPPPPKKFLTSARSRKTWGMSAFSSKSRAESSQTKDVKTTEAENVQTGSIKYMEHLKAIWSNNQITKNPILRRSRLFQQINVVCGDFRKPIWKVKDVKGTLDLSYGGGWILCWPWEMDDSEFWVRAQKSSIYDAPCGQLMRSNGFLTRVIFWKISDCGF